MTTHEQETLTDSYDEPGAESQEAPSAPADAPVQADPPITADGKRESARHSGLDAESSTAEVLFADDELEELRGRWAGVQAAFVDDPKDCVQKATSWCPIWSSSYDRVRRRALAA